ncbi:MAG TPA: class I SAM-dependent methyltransferase, partial [Ktedonobacteraceae bacterium]|nr:class I SAM-dependent methyltransferase [Ktedonobacteraceae bacterium]
WPYWSRSFVARAIAKGEYAMLIELRPLKRKDSGQIIAPLLSALGQVIADYHQHPAYQEMLRNAHVSFDWIQYKSNFRPAIAERPALGIDAQDVHRRELQIDLRQVNVETFPDELRRTLDRWKPPASPAEAPHDLPLPAVDGVGEADRAVAVAARPQTQALPDIDGDKLYLEPFQPARNSIIWSFNTLYWNALDKWEATFQKGYEAALPGGVTDACNPEFVAESVKHVCEVLDELQRKGQLPDQIFVLEIGVGNGAQARTWLDAFQRYTSEARTDYYQRLHYLMSDFSSCVLNAARDAVTPHLEKVSFLVMDATDPLKSLSFLRYKLMFVHISNVYDNLPSSELLKWDNKYYQVEVRAYLPRAEAEKISEQYGQRNLGVTITRFLKIGPDYFDDTGEGVHFWADVWRALKLEERCVLLPELSQLKLFEGFDGRDAHTLLDQVSGNVRMHLNEMALKSFVNTVPLLHPRGFFQVQDIFITELEQYYSAFRGPGKYDGSVVNWVNGPLLRLVGNRFGYDVHFQPFSYRQNSNIIILTTTVRD